LNGGFDFGSGGADVGRGGGNETREVGRGGSGGCNLNCPFEILTGGTGGSALCKTEGTRGIGKGGGGISGAHNDQKTSLTINPDLRPPLTATIERFFQELRSRSQLICFVSNACFCLSIANFLTPHHKVHFITSNLTQLTNVSLLVSI